MWNRGHRSCSFYLILFSLLQITVGVHDFRRADFPTDFVFGAGSSAYQVEGAAFEDGRTASVWDTFVHTSPASPGGNGDIACDQYHKYKEDVQLMAETGLEAYRLSISWSRLIPNGRGPLNPKGLRYYNNLINELIKHGIQPHVTLNHIDLPQALEDEYGGWLSRKIVKDFNIYAEVCFKEFGDRVLHWTTINEPNVLALGGYDNGLIPPGRCSLPFGVSCAKGNSTVEPYIALHNMLLAHSSVFRLYKNKYKAIQHGFVGTNIYSPWFYPSSNATEDVVATQRAIDYFIGWFIHPLVFGDYPGTVKKSAGSRIPELTMYESKLVKSSFDFIGLNHYSTVFIKNNPSNLQPESRDVQDDMGISIEFQPENTHPDQVFQSPVALSGLLEYVKQAYGNPPVYIHENGVSTQRNGTLNDIPRVKFIHAFIGDLLDAIRNGSNTRGYILWSFLDCYEVLSGYKSGYGLYYVDLDDEQLRRYPKLSSYWYSNFLKGRSILPDHLLEVKNAELVGSLPKASQ